MLEDLRSPQKKLESAPPDDMPRNRSISVHEVLQTSSHFQLPSFIHRSTKSLYKGLLKRYERILKTEPGEHTPSFWRSAARPRGLSLRDRTILTRHHHRVSKCCTDVMFAIDETTGEFKLLPKRCYDRSCPVCNVARSRLIRDKLTALVESKVSEGQSTLLLTLTLKNGQATPGHYLSRLVASFAKLRRSTLWKDHVKGGLWVFELCQGKGGWHPHLHVLIESEYLDHKGLKSHWQRLTGDSYIIDVRHANVGIAMYLSNYLSKQMDTRNWSDDQFLDYLLSVRGRRFSGSFGSWYNIRMPEKEKEIEGGEGERKVRTFLLSELQRGTVTVPPHVYDEIKSWIVDNFPAMLDRLPPKSECTREEERPPPPKIA